MNEEQKKVRDALVAPITEAFRTAVTPENSAALGIAASASPALKREPRERRNPRGVFEKVPGSGEWWIRYNDSNGRYRREERLAARVSL